MIVLGLYDLLALIYAAALVTAVMLRLWPMARIPLERCARCGYPSAGVPVNDRCPECGSRGRLHDRPGEGRRRVAGQMIYWTLCMAAFTMVLAFALRSYGPSYWKYSRTVSLTETISAGLVRVNAVAEAAGWGGWGDTGRSFVVVGDTQSVPPHNRVAFEAITQTGRNHPTLTLSWRRGDPLDDPDAALRVWLRTVVPEASLSDVEAMAVKLLPLASQRWVIPPNNATMATSTSGYEVFSGRFAAAIAIACCVVTLTGNWLLWRLRSLVE